MKRDPSLTPLSHDHHQALFQALRMKRATKDDAAAVAAGAREFWSDYGSRHFRHEERALPPLVEEVLEPVELAELGRRVAAAEAGGPDESERKRCMSR